MGTWGFSIVQDDVAADVHADFMTRFNQGDSLPKILRHLQHKSKDMFKDSDDGPIAWLAIAKAAWTCGLLTPQIRARVQRIVDRGEGLERWAEAGPSSLAKRKVAMQAFLKQLGRKNLKPKKPRPPIQRRPVFESGDCLSILLKGGRYTAAIVLGAEQPDPERRFETYGENLIGQLDYLSRSKPTQSLFEKRRWFVLKYDGHRPERHIVTTMPIRFREVQDRFEVVGHTTLRKTDPQESNIGAPWICFEEIAGQKAREGRLTK